MDQPHFHANGIAVALGNELVRISKFRRGWFPNLQAILDLRCVNSPSDNIDGWIMVLYRARTASGQGCKGTKRTASTTWIGSIIHMRSVGYLKMNALGKQFSPQVRFDGQRNSEPPHSRK